MLCAEQKEKTTKTMNTRYFKKLAKGAVLFTASLFSMTSCGDFFDVESTHTVDAGHQLNSATDTIYSMIGVLNKLQAIGDRTVVLGEARGDLVNITQATNADLRDVASFTIGDDNKYNSPADYYAIINNCNYYLHNVDTTLVNNRTKQSIFRKEYAVIKTIRAWTYLQLVTTYGSVPFVTEPILSIDESLKNYPMKDIKGICDYFINEDGLDQYVDQELPGLGNIYGMPSRKFYFPVRIVLGDLNLWAGNYLKAAKYYHDFLINYKKNGIYPVTNAAVEWANSSWVTPKSYSYPTNPKVSDDEVLTVIPMDSIPSAGNFSELPGFFNSKEADNYAVSLTPSKQMFDISTNQWYCYNDDGSVGGVPARKATYAPERKSQYDKTGDLRLGQIYKNVTNGLVEAGGKSYDLQYIYKYPVREKVTNSPQSHQIRVYRRTLIYLRLAEAMNRAGFPRYAFQILSSGINQEVMVDSIAPEYPLQADMLQRDFGFTGSSVSNPNNTYVAITDSMTYFQRVLDDKSSGSRNNINTIGLHSRGSGYTPLNVHYQFPKNLSLDKQIEWVENKILEEGALEFAFEGTRYYDILRVALRRTSEPDFMSKTLNARNGSSASGIQADLMDKANWFLNWKNQIGYNVR